MTPATARSVALEVIRRVIDDGAYSNRLLPSLLARSGLEPRDRAFATELAFGTLRRRLPLDAAIERAASRPLDRVTPTEARHALRLGAYQLSSGVPAHAAVSATVDLVPGRAKGFVNAVLRRLARRDAGGGYGDRPRGDRRANRLASVGRRGTHASRRAGGGGRRGGARDEGAAVDPRAWAAPKPFPRCGRSSRRPGSTRHPGRSIPAVSRSSAVGILARSRASPRADGPCRIRRRRSSSRALDPAPGERVYDACAAPGGKSLLAAERVEPGGAVIAADIAPRRVGLIAETARRLGRRPWLVVHDAAAPAVHGSVRPGPGRRTLQRPRVGPPAARAPVAGAEGRARRARRPPAGDRLGRGGCDRRRGTARVRRLHVHPRRDRRGVRRPAPRPGRPPIRSMTEGPDGPADRHRLWPHRHGCDGMFVAAFPAGVVGPRPVGSCPLDRYHCAAMGTVAASILAADFANFGAQVAAVEPHVGVFHVDIMDGHFVPPIALGAVIVASLRPVTTRPLHGHLMVDAPEGFFDELREAGLDIVSFHLEAVPEPGPAIEKARGAGLGVGLTMNLETPIEAVFPYLDTIDDVMLMSIRPGWSYQTLQRGGLRRAWRASGPRSTGAASTWRLEIDGGVKLDNARRAVDAGATVLIAASGIFAQPDPAEAARGLAEIAADGRVAGTEGASLGARDDLGRRRRSGHRPVRRGEPALGGLRRRGGRRRRGGAHEGRDAAPRPRAARRDDAAHRRVRGRAAPAEESADREHEHHHADRQGAVGRQGDGAAVRRRRLHHQAVRPDRAARPGEGHAAPGQGDAEPLAAHRPAREHPDPGGDRAAGAGGARVRRPVLRPRQLQDVQRPEGVRPRRPVDPGDRAHHPGRRRRGLRGRGLRRTRGWRRLRRGGRSPTAPRTSPSASASGSTRRAPSSTRPRTSTAGSSGWRTAKACSKTSRSWRSRSGSRARRSASSRTTARRWRWPPR